MPIDHTSILRDRLRKAVASFFEELRMPGEERNEKISVNRFPRGDEVCNLFFQNWYSAYSFVFRKNIKVTNIQFGELLSLLRIHSSYLYVSSGIDRDQCATIYERSHYMKELFAELWDALLSPTEPIESLEGDNPLISEFISKFALRYSSFFADTILVDPYAGSCLVFVSPLIALNLEKICSESGYVYICGETVYMRRSNKVSVNGLRKKLLSWLQQNARFSKVTMVIYSRELFPTTNNPDITRAEHNGLDDLKFHLDKFYFGTTPISDLFRELVSPSLDRLRPSTTDAAHFERLTPLRSRHASEVPFEWAGDSNTPSIFLVTERPLELGEPNLPPSKYFHCFVQRFRNANQLYEIDEAKPGWTQSVTLPHTLASAMLNVARGALPRNARSLRILDPFFGCGTTFFETFKIDKAINFHGIDIYWANKLAMEDNLFFLRSSADDKAALIAAIKAMLEGISLSNAIRSSRGIINEVSDESSRKRLRNLFGLDVATREWLRSHNSFSDRFRWIYAHAANIFDDERKKAIESGLSFSAYAALGSITLPDAIKEVLTGALVTAVDRILFFLIWKAFITNLYEFYSQFDDDIFSLKQDIVIAELAKFVIRTERIIRIENAAICERTPQYDLRRGKYSQQICVNYTQLDKVCAYSIRDIKELEGDFENLPNEKRFDIVITDPPYGFNVKWDSSGEDLPDTYIAFMRLILKSVSNGGQIIFCVPSRPLNGQSIPYYMTSAFLIKQFILTARDVGRILRNPVSNLPQPEDRFRAPYYWESERALRRAIIHFQVFDSNSSVDTLQIAQ